jgi:nucleoside-diphosphate-sugar epimerase
MKHTILGIDRSLGKSLAYELLRDSRNLVRLVNHHEYWIPGTETVPIDLTSVEEIRRCLTGSDIVYLCTAQTPMPKDLKDNWIRIVKGTINACKWTNSKLIYIDNADVYGRYRGKITETTPYRPCNDSGKILHDAVLLVEQEMSANGFKCLIARTADIYGPFTNCSNYLNTNVINRVLRNETPHWFIDTDVPHSFTFTRDIAKGVMLLATKEECFNQTWHLPTEPPLSGQTFIHMVSNVIGIVSSYTILSRAALWFSGLYNKESAYNYNRVFRYESGIYFDSTKFNEFFNYTPVSYYEGIKQTIDFLIEG